MKLIGFLPAVMLFGGRWLECTPFSDKGRPGFRNEGLVGDKKKKVFFGGCGFFFSFPFYFIFA